MRYFAALASALVLLVVTAIPAKADHSRAYGTRINSTSSGGYVFVGFSSGYAPTAAYGYYHHTVAVTPPPVLILSPPQTYYVQPVVTVYQRHVYRNGRLVERQGQYSR